MFLLVFLVIPIGCGENQEDRRTTEQELNEVDRQLAPIRSRALRDSTVQARMDAYRAVILDHLRALDDSTAALVDRLVELQEVMEGSGRDRVRSVVGEYRRLHRRLEPARKMVARHPDVRQEKRAYRRALRAQMREISPEADSLLRRLDSLRAEMEHGAGEPGGQ